MGDFFIALFTGIILNVSLMLIIKLIALLFSLSCGWGVAFILAACITWIGVVVFSINDGEIDLF